MLPADEAGRIGILRVRKVCLLKFRLKGWCHEATSDYKEILKDRAVDLVMITTRHNLHASMVLMHCKQRNMCCGGSR